MATYNMRRKRKLQSSPDKKRADAYASPKKRLRSKSTEPQSSPLKSPFTNANDDSPTFATKSFYGKKRRSLASSSSSTASSPVVILSPLSNKRFENINVNLDNGRQLLSDSDSPDSQASGYSRVLRTRDKAKNSQSKKASPKQPKKKVYVTKNLKGSFTPGPKKIDRENLENTPVKLKKLSKSSGKKFFRTKSPATADKMIGSIVVRKGFNLKFVPKRLSGNMWHDSPKNKSDKKKKGTANKYPKLKMVTNSKSKAAKDVFLWESEQSSGENSDPNYMPQKSVNKSVSKTVLGNKKNNQTQPKQTVVKNNAVNNHSGSVTTSQKENSVKQNPKPSAVSAQNSNHGNNSNTLVSASANVLSSYVSVEKCDFEKDSRAADSTCQTQTSPGTVSLVSEAPSKRTESISGSADLFGFDSLISEEDDESSNQLCLSYDCSETPTKEDSTSPCLENSEEKKFYPIFDAKKLRNSTSNDASPIHVRRSLRNSPKLSPGFKFAKDTDGMEQMIIDAGQKRLGAIQCEVCNMLYTQGDPADEADHAKLHQAFINALTFPGWKKERVVQEFPDTGSRVILVLSTDAKYATKKVEEINGIMSKDLGFPEQSVWARPHVQVFLYVNDDKEVEGCVVAEAITEGYRVVPDSQSGSQILSQRTGRPLCCETEPERALLGVSRLWVYGKYRKRGVATRLVDTVRQVFEHGVMIEKEKIAFSDPTSDGKNFAIKYCGTTSFLVYRFM